MKNGVYRTILAAHATRCVYVRVFLQLARPAGRAAGLMLKRTRSKLHASRGPGERREGHSGEAKERNFRGTFAMRRI